MHFFDFSSKSLCLWCVRGLYHDSGIIDLFIHQPFLCFECQSMINSPISFDHNGIKGEAVIEYNQTIERILFRYKEDKDICMSLSFFYHCKKYFKKHKDWIFLVVPSSDDKIRERGFHPLHEMVKDYAYIVSMSLHKSKNIKQSQQHKIGRSAIKEIIYCDDVTQFKNKKVVIIDDVMTTGSTLDACYNIIKDQACEVKYFVFAIHPLLINKAKSGVL